MRTPAASLVGIRASYYEAALSLGALGVVFGDIGTSPLYALRESGGAAGGKNGAIAEAAVLDLAPFKARSPGAGGRITAFDDSFDEAFA